MNKRFSFFRVLPVIAVGAVLATSCFGDRKEGDMASAEGAKKMGVLNVDSVYWQDSLELKGNKAHVSIDGWYPVGGEQSLADSARAWILQCLTSDEGDKKSVASNSSLLSDGKTLVATAGRALIDSANVAFQGLNRENELAEFNFTVEFEHIYSFAPVYHTDKIYTYNFSSYDYLGGAHGSSQKIGQTFVVATGERLDAAKMFLPESVDQLVGLIADELWKQYFAPSHPDAANGSLAGELLIAPELLQLPECAPICVENGVQFLYQHYEIACYAAGMPQCVLPYDVVKPFMRPDVASLMP